ncbi:MAG: hypothetical protein IPI31_10870 [Bacteroidetes bacterium]|nr:hypothetical protein [Bacteroidota bacterium]
MKMEIKENPMLQNLPPQLKIAQEAINNPEVQEMIKKLAQFNLGVFMPHQHNQTTGDFELLEDGMMQMENDLEVSFVPINNTDPNTFLPVGWVWKFDGLNESAACTFGCHNVISPTTGAAVHIKQHK